MYRFHFISKRSDFERNFKILKIHKIRQKNVLPLAFNKTGSAQDIYQKHAKATQRSFPLYLVLFLFVSLGLVLLGTFFYFEFCGLNIKSFFNRLLYSALLPLLLKLLIGTWVSSVCLQFRPSISPVAQVVFGCLFPCTRISTHFSVVNSVLIVFAEDIRLLLNFY